MSLNVAATNDFMAGAATRSMVDLNVAAVTASFDGGENRYPGRIVNVYVRPPFVGVGTDAATSGTMLVPSGAGSSGYVTRFAQIAYSMPRGVGSAGSSESTSSCMVKCAAP